MKSVIDTESRTSVPLCVDMDGTLVATDLLWESLLQLLKNKPVMVCLFPVWLMRGKAFFKRQVAREVRLDPAHLPYREEVLSFLRAEKASGRELILASASDQQIVERVAGHLGMFSAALGSDGKVNLSGRSKLKALEMRTGPQGFDYMGNSTADIPIWEKARHAILVNPSSRVLARTRDLRSREDILVPRVGGLLAVMKALRVHQWAKNILLFVPLVMAHRTTELTLLFQVIVAFVAFSLCASSVYIINDLLDLVADRQHPLKRNRPFAAGTVQIKSGVLLTPLLLAIAFGVAVFFLPPLFSAALASYVVLATAYSFYLKNTLIVDVLLLAGLYTLRVLSGGIAVNVVVSPWLLAFSMFLFLSLAYLKRYSELLLMKQQNRAHSTGRMYRVEDVDLLRSMGSTSGYLSILVVALYINSEEVALVYARPTLLWLIGPCLLYWLTRAWFLAHRGAMADDPVVFAFRDGHSYIVGAVILAILILASA